MPSNKSILIVDDDLNDIELAKKAFEKTKLPNSIVTARHGGEALDYLYRRGNFAGREGNDPVFIMLDLKMPKVSGLDVLRQIKVDNALKLIPVVMFTSSKEERDLLACYSLGVNSYVVKPVEFAQFSETIRQLSLYWALINETPPATLTA